MSDDPRPGLIARIREWQRATFPAATSASVAAHVAREAAELQAAPDDGSEWADLIFLAVQGADRAGVDLWAEVEAKLAVNLARRWPAQPDAAGVYEHHRD